jgi:hypothetical protein
MSQNGICAELAPREKHNADARKFCATHLAG